MFTIFETATHRKGINDWNLSGSSIKCRFVYRHTHTNRYINIYWNLTSFGAIWLSKFLVLLNKLRNQSNAIDRVSTELIAHSFAFVNTHHHIIIAMHLWVKFCLPDSTNWLTDWLRACVCVCMFICMCVYTGKYVCM